MGLLQVGRALVVGLGAFQTFQGGLLGGSWGCGHCTDALWYITVNLGDKFTILLHDLSLLSYMTYCECRNMTYCYTDVTKVLQCIFCTEETQPLSFHHTWYSSRSISDR